ncbi:MAG TPA: hypothetical protein VLH79_13520 [Chthonomonadales bacterium]|nr:hypothetical protein [Chthonomonadales bacterium]
MGPVRIARFAVTACALLGLATPVLASPDGRAIVRRMNAAMQSAVTSAASYQAVIDMNMTMGEMGTMVSTLDLKVIPGKSLRIVTTPSDKSTGMFAMAAAQGAMQMVDDGKTLWIYQPALKQYMKQPSQIATMGPGALRNLPGVGNQLDEETLKNSRVVVTGTRTVQGRPAHVVQVTPNRPARGVQSMTLLIDRATHRLRGITTVANQPVAQGQPPQRMTVQITFRNERVGAAIPASVFRFTPPPGSTEVQMPAQGRPGGAQGRPGGAPGRPGGAPPPPNR